MSKFCLAKACPGKRPASAAHGPTAKSPAKSMRLSVLRGDALNKHRYPHVDKDMVDRLMATKSFMSVALHTHDYSGKMGKGTEEYFGMYAVCDPQDLGGRVVGLAWAFNFGGSGHPTTKSFVLKCDGVSISDKAAKFHGIDNVRAEVEGHTGRAVFEEFMEDARQVVAHGGRLCAHHLGC